jgi:hypothetical protein
MSHSLVFPSDLQSQQGSQAYPQIEFTVREDSKPNAINKNMFTHVYLPLPRGVQFSDGGDYQELELGSILGGGIADAASKLSQGNLKGVGSDLGNAAEQQLNMSSIGTRVKGALLKKGAEAIGVSPDVVGLLQKKIMAPNKNTTFKGNTMRSFSFSFTLIARSKADADQMQKIQRLFRRYTYAGSSADNPNVVLDYPPVWKIRFLGDDMAENRFMPKIFSCYLKSFDCTFNKDQNAFRTDGSPFDMSFALSFTETRVLTRQDIDNLENITNQTADVNRGIDPNTGQATTAVPIDTTLPIQPPGASTESPPTQATNPNLPTNNAGSFPVASA